MFTLIMFSADLKWLHLKLIFNNLCLIQFQVQYLLLHQLLKHLWHTLSFVCLPVRTNRDVANILLVCLGGQVV